MDAIFRSTDVIQGMSIAHRSAPARQSPPNRINKLDKRPPTPTPTPPTTPRWPLWLVLGGVVLATSPPLPPGYRGFGDPGVQLQRLRQ